MKRREAIFQLAGTVSLATMYSEEAAAQQSAKAAEDILRSVAGVEPRPGEALSTMAVLEAVRFRRAIDPRIEPAITFDPEGAR